ncbi:HlyD family efflux transporter periplasmic adaptor subunit [Sulfitobacter sp. S190]|uniref:HlyD family efflux transporter periplasmic adaptor subunit n=1 Tax=Sulfitobacter sp. S190 TaxID=2867022 RepID=UPI0021A51806|nr:HlyD family efflux transporter periplasmic adaptor subunit [Sulfitobacter sp. S190]UWR21358.1 HlyD family efflux transporter periplasmic adaptor subunit [Sulfitobacter sp. S190]
MSKHDPAPSAELPLTDNGLGATVPERNAPARRRKPLLRLVPLAMVFMFMGGVLGLYFQPPALRVFFATTGLTPGAGTETPIAVALAKVRTQEEVAVVSEGDIVALGRILPAGDVIRIATPFGASDARIDALEVAVGDTVAQGDTLAVLDNRRDLQSDIEIAAATVKVREAALMQMRETVRASREEAAANLERAEITAQQAQSELERATSLLDRGVTTRADLDVVVARATEAARDVERNRATLSRYNGLSGTVQADIAVAEANLDAARVDLRSAERNLERSIVRAPRDGTVLGINVQVGERPGTDGILNLGDIAQMTVEAEVYQTLIGRVSIGDPVTVAAAALGEDLSGTVQAIGLEIGRQSITSDDPAANTDARVVDVIVMLDPASSDRAKRYTNLETIVRIDTERSE